MDELISKKAVLNAIDEISREVDDGDGFDYAKWREYFCELPPAQFATDTNVGNKLGTNFAEVGTDLIGRQAAIEVVQSRPMMLSKEKVLLINDLKKLPPAEPKMGKWISADAMFGGVPFYCSECGENTWDTVMGKPRWNFCPMCGSYNGGEYEV